jgi:hypothetical protein
VSQEDRAVLRELAARVATIAALPEQQATRAGWVELNGLRPVRPMVALDQLPWHELADGEDSLRSRCSNPFLRGYETQLRRTLYRWRHIRADMLVDAEILVPKVICAEGGFGISMRQETLAVDPRNDIVAHRYLDQLASEEAVEAIRPPTIRYDEELTQRLETTALEVFDGLLPVRLQGWVPGATPWPALEAQPATRHLANAWPEDTLLVGFNLWDVIAEWRSVEATLFDLAARPDHMHRIIGRLTDACLAALDDLESRGLLGYGQAEIHCTPCGTDELPHAGFDPARPRAEDLWTMGMAQVLTSVSPHMFREFEVDYSARWFSRFGLGYYGCCDVLDERIDLIRAIPHVRKISMCPWADVERGAEAIGRDFVFSAKPNPAWLAGERWHPEAVERDLRHTIEACWRSGSPLEIILKDVSTIRGQPSRLRDWVDIAMRLATSA